MNRVVPLAEGEYYHIYSRGVEKRPIFLDDNDRERFIKLLHIANSENSFVYRDVEKKTLDAIDPGKRLVAIGAYVLMDNHFHILIKEIGENGITNFMQKLLTGYSSYFNKRHSRTGTLFQSRYQSQHVSRDEHLKYLFAYIHLNPVKRIEPRWKEDGLKNMSAVKKLLSVYSYSSYMDYIGQTYGSSRVEELILSKKEFPHYFAEGQGHQFQEFVQDWLTLKNAETT